MAIERLPISVKGIVFAGAAVWLRKNERNEWELPGGKLDQDEQPVQTVEREIEEELGIHVSVDAIISADIYKISTSPGEQKRVLVICYLCQPGERVNDFEWEGEAGRADYKQFSIEAMDSLSMPVFYKNAIKTAWSKFQS